MPIIDVFDVNCLCVCRHCLSDRRLLNSDFGRTSVSKMVLVSGQSLQCFQDYTEEKVKLRVVHFCPIDGHETDPKCKRTVITSDCFSTANPSSDRLVVVTFYGSLAKTPFKKSALKEGQLFTLQHFQTSIMPKNKVFKCNF